MIFWSRPRAPIPAPNLPRDLFSVTWSLHSLLFTTSSAFSLVASRCKKVYCVQLAVCLQPTLMQCRSTGTPFSAPPVTRELGLVPTSRTADRTGNEAELIRVLVHVHVHVVQLSRLILLRLCRRFSYHFFSFSANLELCTQNLGLLQELSSPNRQRASCCSVRSRHTFRVWVPDTSFSPPRASSCLEQLDFHLQDLVFQDGGRPGGLPSEFPLGHRS